MRKNHLFIVIVLVLFVVAGFASANERFDCQVCGMYIDQYQKTAGKLEYQDGRIVQSCGLACLLRMVEDAGGPDAFKVLAVKDWVTGETVAAEQASYVLSSDVIPDMLPSVIAFRDPEDAQLFQQENGGEVITFSQALLVISPTAMTMPARIQTAVVPAKGSSGIGLSTMIMNMDRVVIGDDSYDPADFIKRPGQMMGPKEMETTGAMLMLNYGITDYLALGIKTSYLDKEMEMYTMGGKQTKTTDNSGLGDIQFSFRYNFYKNTGYSHFATALAEFSVPTGDFDDDYISQPGLQLGTGDLTFGGGLLYTYRYEDFWLHSMARYTHKLENSDKFKFGDESRFGIALHYTPNYDLMFGIETDVVHYDENENMGVEVGNSGGWRSYITGVASWRFLTALGGNFNLRLMGGLPIYEDLNDTIKMGQEAVQMGGGWFCSLAISFNRRYSPFETDHH